MYSAHMDVYQVKESRPIFDVEKFWRQQGIELGVELGVLQVMVLQSEKKVTSIQDSRLN
jgi:hypothetical protein